MKYGGNAGDGLEVEKREAIGAKSIDDQKPKTVPKISDKKASRINIA